MSKEFVCQYMDRIKANVVTVTHKYLATMCFLSLYNEFGAQVIVSDVAQAIHI